MSVQFVSRKRQNNGDDGDKRKQYKPSKSHYSTEPTNFELKLKIAENKLKALRTLIHTNFPEAGIKNLETKLPKYKRDKLDKLYKEIDQVKENIAFYKDNINKKSDEIQEILDMYKDMFTQLTTKAIPALLSTRLLASVKKKL